MRILLIALIHILIYFSVHAASTNKETGRIPNLSISGAGDLTTHFLHHGLSYSDGNPALNALFLLHMGSQFKFGFWGTNISNVSDVDDNFWFRFVGEIKVDFNAITFLETYIHDHRFYKSDLRNGQSLGFKVTYLKKYVGLLELNTNFEGTHSNSEYMNLTYIHKYRPKLIFEGSLGYTNQRADTLNNYWDLKLQAMYKPIDNLGFYVGSTATSDAGQLNTRGNSAIIGGIEFSF